MLFKEFTGELWRTEVTPALFRSVLIDIVATSLVASISYSTLGPVSTKMGNHPQVGYRPVSGLDMQQLTKTSQC